MPNVSLTATEPPLTAARLCEMLVAGKPAKRITASPLGERGVYQPHVGQVNMMHCAVCGQPAPVWDEKRRRWLCYTHTISQLKKSINHPTDEESDKDTAEAGDGPEQEGS